MRIAAIYRYPVKGLSPERLERTALHPDSVIGGDRRYAIENGPSGFDASAPSYQPKIKFLMLMRNERLAQLDTAFDDATTTLTIRSRPEGHELSRGDLSTPQGRAAIEAFFKGYMAGELRGEPRVLEGPAEPTPFSFSDVAAKVVSLINTASVADLGRHIGREVDPLRFRGNLLIEDLEPWAEFDLLGRVLTAPSGARLEVVKRIVRCAATEVDPATGLRDMSVPRTLQKAYGHMDCGVYARVLDGGALNAGDRLVAEAQ